jgi:hypothetical protein
MVTALQAVFFAAIAIAIGWYAWRGIAAGKIMIGIRGIGEFWFDQRQDPFTIWIVISFVAFPMILAAIIAVRTVLQN